MAIEALAADEYRLGHLTKPDLRRWLGLETSYEINGFLKRHAIFDDYTLQDLGCLAPDSLTRTSRLRYQGSVKLLLLIALLSLALSAASPEENIRAAEKAWNEAVVKQDFAALERIFSPDLIYAHSTGNIETRDEYLARLRTGKQRYDTFTYEKSKVNVYGASAVMHSTVRVTGKNDSGAFNDHLMMMHFWVKKGKAWVLVAHQTTRIP